ncbi:MAG TPA: ATP-binding cassette domain-containing protein [Alphaproteobacteria bacterium]|nr:ATP-binding cassette domain-containing protein [Alphaproteobacteria bacterium]
MTSVVRCQDLSKRFGGIVVADRINLELKGGEIVGLIGPNGAGKTSLFNLICGVVQPDEGHVYVGSRRVEKLPIYQHARLGLARTWQHVRLFNSLTVMDNLLIAPRDYLGESLLKLMFGLKRLSAANHEALDRAGALLERVGLAHKAAAHAFELSYGQQKLLGIARALMNDGDCLLLDEPMAGVEGRTYDTIKAVVRTEAERGKAICVIEHNVAFVRDICDHAVFMFNGSIMASGSVDALMADRRLTDLYFGAGRGR